MLLAIFVSLLFILLVSIRVIPKNMAEEHQQPLSDRVLRAARAFQLHEHGDDVFFVHQQQVPQLSQDASDALLPFLVAGVSGILLVLWFVFLYRPSLSPKETPINPKRNNPPCRSNDHHPGSALRTPTKNQLARTPSNHRPSKKQENGRAIGMLPSESRNNHHHQGVSPTDTLATDNNTPHPLAMVVKPNSCQQQQTLITTTTTTPIQRYETTMDDARAYLRTASLLEVAAAQAGRSLQPGEAMQFAVHRLSHAELLHQQDCREARSYLYDHRQRCVDRTLQERRHQEMLQTARMEHGWIVQIRQCRDRVHDSIVATLFRGACVHFFLELLLPLWHVWVVWQQATLSERLCSWTGSPNDPFGSSQVNNDEFASMGQQQQAWWRPLLLWLMDTTTMDSPCVVHNVYRGTVVLFWVVGIVVLGMCHSYGGIPVAITSTLQLAVLLMAFYVHQVLPMIQVFTLGNCVALCTALVAALCVEHKHRYYLRKFKRDPPSATDVNHCALWFDDCTFCVHICQGMMLVGGVATVGYHAWNAFL